MAILLTPRIYGQSMKWQISPKNKIDTVTANPILNTIASEPDKFFTSEALPVKILGQTEQITLPIAATIKPTYFRTMRNRHRSITDQVEYAKARTDIVMGYGETEITLSQPVDGIPNVTIQLEGKSYKIDRGQSSYESMPGFGDLNNIDYSLANWIASHYSQDSDSLSWHYNDDSFSTNPWVLRIVPNVGDATAADVITNWGVAEVDPGYNQPWGGTWSHNSNYEYSGDLVFSAAPYGTAALSPGIYLYDDSISMNMSIEKIDSYKYKLSYTVPLRIAYLAASRQVRTFTGASKDIDNWYLVDYITAVKAVFIGKPYNTDDVTIQYGLDSNGNLTTNTRNTNVLKIDKSEFVTMSSTITPNGLPWTEEMFKRLLNKYAKGKYMVTCEVPASWAIQNGIHPESELQIAQQNGQLISRQGTPCTFKVKTITKSFRNNAFMFSLGLMEV